MDAAAMIERFRAAMQSPAQRTELPAFRDARLYYKHGLDRMEDPNGPNLERPGGLAGIYGRGSAMKGAAKDAARNAVSTM